MEEAAAGGSAATVAGNRSTTPEHKGQRESRHFDRESGSAGHRARAVGDITERRSGLDHVEGAGEGPGAEVWHTLCSGDGCRKLSRKPPRGSAPGGCCLSSSEVCAPARGGSWGSVGSRGSADRFRRNAVGR